MRVQLAALAIAGVMASAGAGATDPAPEISRSKPFQPQAREAAHVLRTIPEACVSLEGTFTGDAATPYRLQPRRSAPQCQPRARLVPTLPATPLQQGWILNDRIRVAQAACPGHVAVVSVWRRPGKLNPPALDAQGRSRIYLDEAKRQAHAKAQADAIPAYATVVQTQGAACTP